MIVGNGFFFVKSKEMMCTVDDAQQFYMEHKGGAGLSSPSKQHRFYIAL